MIKSAVYFLNTLLLTLIITLFSQATFADSKISVLSDNSCRAMVEAGVMSHDAPVPCARLRQVEFDYIDFQGEHHTKGVMVVMDAVAPYVANIFDGLYQLQFPIHKARPMTDYQGDDKRSMADNNSSAFNYRAVTGKKSLSLHAYGLAIDINPIQNPFIEFDKTGVATFSPSGGVNHANRMRYRFGKKQPQGFAEDLLALFADNGFLYWGGFWDTPIDYQHFQVSRTMANVMSAMPSEDAALFFSQYVNWYRSCKAMYPVAYSQHRVNDYVHYLENELSSGSLYDSYKKSPQHVVSIIQTRFRRSEICVKN